MKNEFIMRLWINSPTKNVFNHPGWYESLRKSFYNDSDFLELTGPDTLDGYWPFVMHKRTIKELFFCVIMPLGALNSDYIAPIVNHDTCHEFLSCIAQALVAELNFDKILVIPNLRMLDSDINFFVAQLTRLDLRIKQRKNKVWRMRFATSWEAQTKTWSSSHRGDIGRQLRRLIKLGSTELFVASNPIEVIHALEEMFERHQIRWAQAGFVSEFTKLHGRQFYFELVRSIPFEQIHYSEVRLNGKPISHHFGFLDDGWIFWYKPAYDIEFQNYSPGKVHLAMLTQYGIERGLKGIDFLQGDEGYKKLWANDSIVTTSLSIATKAGILPWLWHTRYREKAKKALTEVKKIWLRCTRISK